MKQQFQQHQQFQHQRRNSVFAAQQQISSARAISAQLSHGVDVPLPDNA